MGRTSPEEKQGGREDKIGGGDTGRRRAKIRLCFFGW